MTVYRCFAWDERAADADPDGPLWFPRPLQGDGRHDNPDRYGCLYVSEREVSTVVEQLARFRAQHLIESMLWRRGLPLAIAEIEISARARLIDLDDPAVLADRGLRPSQVASRNRTLTQAQARLIHEKDSKTDGLLWWSMFEATWINLTLFDRARRQLRLIGVRRLSVTDPLVREAAEFLGMRPAWRRAP